MLYGCQFEVIHLELPLEAEQLKVNSLPGKLVRAQESIVRIPNPIFNNWIFSYY